MRSMTGYSKLRYENEKFSVIMEIKSVNNKNLNLKTKIPYSLNFLENRLRTELSKKITRGSIDLRIDFQDKEEGSNSFQYDKATANSCMRIFSQMEGDFSEKINNKLQILISNFGVVKRIEEEIDETEYSDFIIPKFLELLDGINEMKTLEGERLREFFIERVSVIEEKVAIIKLNKEAVVQQYREKFLERLNKIKSDTNFTEEDILKEVLVYADKVDISEEVTRLESHLVQIKTDLNNNTENLGKKIDFILQEMFREFNTTGVKCNLYEISKLVVEAKNEIEKIREQALNIE